MDLFEIFQKLGIAVGLGLLVGLQREYSASQIAGIRTFPIVAVFGSLCGLLAQVFGGWAVAAGGLSLAAMIVSGNIQRVREPGDHGGVTTEVAALLMFAVGAYLIVGHAAVAVAVSGGLAVLLQWKQPLHGFVQRMGQTDIRAIMQFALITLVILPVLPNAAYGPYQALNPYKIWLMVVLIVAISLGGYVAFKYFGQTAGAVLAGILGGLISSTATTVSYARRAKETPNSTSLAAVIILIATTVSFFRMMAEIIVVAPNVAGQLLPPLAMMGVGLATMCAGVYFLGRRDGVQKLEPGNPAELTSALVFGGLYALVTVGVAVAKDYFGDRGLYGMAILSGLHDVDAITLSTAQLVQEEQLESATGWRVILVAALANLVTKALIAGFLGRRQLFYRVAAYFLAALIGGCALIVLWPNSWQWP